MRTRYKAVPALYVFLAAGAALALWVQRAVVAGVAALESDQA